MQPMVLTVMRKVNAPLIKTRVYFFKWNIKIIFFRAFNESLDYKTKLWGYKRSERHTLGKHVHTAG